jgi:hypothetical protein
LHGCWIDRRCITWLQVEFNHPVDAKGNIEVWLQRLVDGMQDTVKQLIKRGVRNVYVSCGKMVCTRMRHHLFLRRFLVHINLSVK